MRAAVMHRGQVALRHVPDPRPRGGHVLVRPVACGICGSDLGALRHGADIVALRREVEARAPHSPLRAASVDPAVPFVPGHEFCTEVVVPGPERPDLSPGDLVVSVPRIFDEQGRKHTIGYSPSFPGALGELMVLDPGLVVRVPPDVDPLHAALTEPLAVARHAVDRSDVASGTAAVVVGCGPVGLAIVACLAADGVAPILASDPVASRRRRALALGADVAVDPREETPVAVWRERFGGPPPAVFEAVGKPGMLDLVLLDAVADTRIVVVGACMGPDTIRPMLALGRELTVRFVLGYTVEEFTATLADIAQGRLRPELLIAETVPLEELPATFERMRRSPPEGKVLVVPQAA